MFCLFFGVLIFPSNVLVCVIALCFENLKSKTNKHSPLCYWNSFGCNFTGNFFCLLWDEREYTFVTDVFMVHNVGLLFIRVFYFHFTLFLVYLSFLLYPPSGNEHCRINKLFPIWEENTAIIWLQYVFQFVFQFTVHSVLVLCLIVLN